MKSKGNNELKIELVKSAVKNANQTNFGLVKNTQGNEHREAKNKYQGKIRWLRNITKLHANLS